MAEKVEKRADGSSVYYKDDGSVFLTIDKDGYLTIPVDMINMDKIKDATGVHVEKFSHNLNELKKQGLVVTKELKSTEPVTWVQGMHEMAFCNLGDNMSVELFKGDNGEIYHADVLGDSFGYYSEKSGEKWYGVGRKGPDMDSYVGTVKFRADNTVEKVTNYNQKMEIAYKQDGKSIDYKIINGKRICDNTLARARFKVASKLGLGEISLPDWAKKAERKLSSKIDVIKNKTKTNTNTVQKPTRTNGGRS